MIASAAPSDDVIRCEFEELLPELSSRLRHRFREYGADWGAEYIAEAIALSWSYFLSARRRDKTVNAGNLAWYATKAVLCGRRLAGSTGLDALSVTARSAGRGRPVSLTDLHPDAGGSRRLYLVIGDKRWRFSVLELVSTKMTWDQLLADSDEHDRQIVRRLIEGDSQKQIARGLGVSPARVCQRLASLRARWEAISAA